MGKRKKADLASSAGLSPDICWDLKLKGSCRKGDNCKWSHDFSALPERLPTELGLPASGDLGQTASKPSRPGVPLTPGQVAGTPLAEADLLLSVPDISEKDFCHAFKTFGSCAQGDKCKWVHDPTDPRAAKRAKTIDVAAEAEAVAKKQQLQVEYETWATERLEPNGDPEGQNFASLDWWYASVCLVCATEVQLANWQVHAEGNRHRTKYTSLGGLRLRDGVLRPEPHLKDDIVLPKQKSMYQQRSQKQWPAVVVPPRVGPPKVVPPPTAEQLAAVPIPAMPFGPPANQVNQAEIDAFATAAGYAHGCVLSLGEQDFSFSLSIAKLQKQAGYQVQLVASSYLGEHDPNEREVHVSDDAVRATYSRRTLPSMNGDLARNLQQLINLGSVNLHSVDATNLDETLIPQLGGPISFDIIAFPFPRASLKRCVDPKNSTLVRDFFKSVVRTGLLSPGGVVHLLMLQTQFPEWDTACMAIESGFILKQHVLLPEGFYQSREMSGKAWTPQNAQLYVFSFGGV